MEVTYDHLLPIGIETEIVDSIDGHCLSPSDLNYGSLGEVPFPLLESDHSEEEEGSFEKQVSTEMPSSTDVSTSGLGSSLLLVTLSPLQPSEKVDVHETAPVPANATELRKMLASPVSRSETSQPVLISSASFISAASPILSISTAAPVRTFPLESFSNLNTGSPMLPFTHLSGVQNGPCRDKVESLRTEVCGSDLAAESSVEAESWVHMESPKVKSSDSVKEISKAGRGVRKVKKHTRMRRKTLRVCDVCQASFTRSDCFRKHKLIHAEQKPYVCKVCNADFIHSGSLTEHLRTHTGERPLACDQCDATFAHSFSLKRHMKTHSGDKPYACTECDAAFKQSVHLTTHMRTHTGQHPFTCEECNRRFTQSSSLKRHMQTHTGHKPHTCKVCGASFYRPYCLVEHMQTHKGDRK